MGKKGLIKAIVGEDGAPKKEQPTRITRDHLEDDSPIDTYNKLVCELAIRNLMFKRMKLMNPNGTKLKRPVVLEPFRAIRFMRMIKCTGYCGMRQSDLLCLTAFGLLNIAGVRTVVTPNGIKILEETRDFDQMKLISGCNKNTERDDID